jgi:MFS family permease
MTGSFVLDVLPGMILFGFGAGIAFNAVLLAAMSDVDPSDSGLASGIVNTSLMMGGALGLAVLASLAAARSDAMQASESVAAALNSGYHVAFLVGAIFAAAAGVLGGLLLRPGRPGGAGARPVADSHGVTTAGPAPTTGNAAATEHY